MANHTPSKQHRQIVADFTESLMALGTRTDIGNPNIAIAALVDSLLPVPATLDGASDAVYAKRNYLHNLADGIRRRAQPR